MMNAFLLFFIFFFSFFGKSDDEAFDAKAETDTFHIRSADLFHQGRILSAAADCAKRLVFSVIKFPDKTSVIVKSADKFVIDFIFDADLIKSILDVVVFFFVRIAEISRDTRRFAGDDLILFDLAVKDAERIGL